MTTFHLLQACQLCRDNKERKPKVKESCPLNEPFSCNGEGKYELITPPPIHALIID